MLGTRFGILGRSVITLEIHVPLCKESHSWFRLDRSLREVQSFAHAFSPALVLDVGMLAAGILRYRWYASRLLQISDSCSGVLLTSFKWESGRLGIPHNTRGPKGHKNTRISHSGSKAQYKGDTRCFLGSLCLCPQPP